MAVFCPALLVPPAVVIMTTMDALLHDDRAEKRP
jgi:hypothetical protein